MKNLIDESMINDILKVLSNNGEYSYDLDGLKINASNKDGKLNFSCSYIEDNSEQVKKNCSENRERFYNYCQSIDSDLFVETCEAINLKEVTALVESDEHLDEGIKTFMDALQKVALNKANEITSKIIDLEDELKNLYKRKESYSKYID